MGARPAPHWRHTAAHIAAMGGALPCVADTGAASPRVRMWTWSAWFSRPPRFLSPASTLKQAASGYPCPHQVGEGPRHVAGGVHTAYWGTSARTPQGCNTRAGEVRMLTNAGDGVEGVGPAEERVCVP